MTGRQQLNQAARHIFQLFKQAAISFAGDRCTQMAATIAYYALFALFPLVILAASIFGLIQGTEEARQQIIDLVTEIVVLTPDGERTLEQTLDGVTRNSEVFGLIGLVGLLFSGSGVMSAVRNALNTAFEVEDRRPPVHGKLVDISIVLCLGLAVAVSLGLTLIGQLAPSLGEGRHLIDAVLGPAPIVINFAIFAFLFYSLPATEVRPRDIWPGALFAALGYEAAKIGFAFYLANFGNYSAIYGSVAAIIVFMFFVYIVANIFLFGGEMASEWGKVKRGEYDRDEPGESRTWSARARSLARQIVYRGDRE